MSNIQLTEFSQYIKNGKKSERLEALLKDSSGLEVYRNNYLFNHIEKLENIFLTSSQVLGENNFRFFCSQYLSNVQLTSESIDFCGDAFPAFINEQIDIHNIPYLSWLSHLDLFHYRQNLESQVEVPTGLFDLWASILQGGDVTDIEISCSLTENIGFYKEPNGELSMGPL